MGETLYAYRQYKSGPNRGIWHIEYDPQAMRDRALGAAVRKAVVEALHPFPCERPWIELRDTAACLHGDDDDFSILLYAIADALDAEAKPVEFDGFREAE
ncbi:MAG TPA: hypothetical protein VMY98_04025 [Anaerolineae bacterium]|nr:hypothetical protein [Anaerolineae bacterium]